MGAKKCGQPCTIYSRVVGYYRPTADWNVGKVEEFKDRVEFDADKAAEKMLDRRKQ